LYGTTENCRHRLDALLQQEAGCMQRFGVILEQESSAIAARDIAALETVVREKLALVGQLEALNQERGMLLASSGFTSGMQGMKECLQWCDPQQRLAPGWAALLNVAAVCRQKNRRNRQLIEVCCQHTREALQVLHGAGPHRDTCNTAEETKPAFGRHSLVRT
jgi:flagellar biosynthesis/type III secretory pathway chaperone